MENREIKFRGKDKQSRKWVYGDLIQCDGYFTICNRTKIGENEYETLYYEVIPESVGQYTGLNDRNGVEIYDGDILEMKNGTRNPYIVEWKNNFLAGYYIDGNPKGVSTLLFQYVKHCRVIGNIIDNPELLTNKN